jgi:selenocysteine-specific elongation factor
VATLARVVGTAGHIDHGKTSLVRALTGIDTDRLKEEKERGITIELGFAHLALPSAPGAARGAETETVGVVDVPGHERFVRTMVAGAVGIDLVVLVVAADEGVMPQTREHLDICQLLGIQRGVVALTKADLVDGELRALALAELGEALAGTFLQEAPVIACSARSGEGLDALKLAIQAGLRDLPGKDAEGLLRLPIDRVFSMKGFGTVLTGTLWAGRLRAGDDVVALPPLGGAASVGKVRGVQVHGAAVAEARAGNRTAVNVTLDKEGLARGQVLARPGELEAGRLVDVRLRLLASTAKALKRRSRLLLHAGTAQTLATVTLLDAGALEPGQSALAQLQLDEPMLLEPGDRFILRGFAVQRHYGTTVGGGVVLRTLGARLRRGTPELLAELRQHEEAWATGDVERRVRLEVERAGGRGLSRAELLRRLPYGPRLVDAQLERLWAARAVLRYDKEREASIARSALTALADDAVAIVDAHHQAQPLQPGMAREELRSRLALDDARLLHAVLESLRADGRLAVERELVRLPSFAPQSERARAGLQPLAERVLQLYSAAALAPPRATEAALTLGVDSKELTPALDLLVRGGSLVRIQDLFFARPAVDDLRARLIAFLQAHSQISAQQFKELVGQSRKFSIPLAEYFDAEKVTMRVGEVRRRRGA